MASKPPPIGSIEREELWNRLQAATPHHVRLRDYRRRQEALDWCDDEFGVAVTLNTDTYCFKTAEQAAMFKLKFG